MGGGRTGEVLRTINYGEPEVCTVSSRSLSGFHRRIRGARGFPQSRTLRTTVHVQPEDATWDATTRESQRASESAQRQRVAVKKCQQPGQCCVCALSSREMQHNVRPAQAAGGQGRSGGEPAEQGLRATPGSPLWLRRARWRRRRARGRPVPGGFSSSP